MKVTIVGAGNVGASCAEYILIKQIAQEVILVGGKRDFAASFAWLGPPLLVHPGMR